MCVRCLFSIAVTENGSARPVGSFQIRVQRGRVRQKTRKALIYSKTYTTTVLVNEKASHIHGKNAYSVGLQTQVE